jgi:ArsR family transcriptional regulator
MEMASIIRGLSALAQPTRLATFTKLAEAGEAGMGAGQIAADVGVPANTMSSHLMILAQAGLLEQSRSGRNITYRAIPSRVIELSSFLSGLVAPGM